MVTATGGRGSERQVPRFTSKEDKAVDEYLRRGTYHGCLNDWEALERAEATEATRPIIERLKVLKSYAFAGVMGRKAARAEVSRAEWELKETQYEKDRVSADRNRVERYLSRLASEATLMWYIIGPHVYLNPSPGTNERSK